MAAATTVSAVEFRFTNKCEYTINLHGSGSKFICDIAPGAKADNNGGAPLGTIGLFKHSPSNEANCTWTLLEYSLINSGYGLNQVWYDVSNIPPGPGWCSSYEDCKAFTGRKGYNVPMLVIPTKFKGKANCKQLYVTRPDAPDAYLFPADNTKTHDCAMDEVFDVIFCPDNNAPAPTTAAAPVVTTKAPSPPVTTKAPSPPVTTVTPPTTSTYSPPPVTPSPPTPSSPPLPKAPSSTTDVPATTSTSSPATPASPTVVPTSVSPVATTSRVSSPPKNDDGYIKPWFQCGGKGYSGSSLCGTGHSCVAISDWYSQCIPDAPQFGELATWAQCGGTGFQGKAACLPRDTCVKRNDYFYQCEPKDHHN
ncbi:hypothetical protein B5M09_004988 [Aphanomyces astaci]|uniref:CBM1 domain-containing protein n=1 Tax=Aphanomyces astaci TaxID=112090 RepID=A0A3R7WMV5_APHAT|nr:hypothetical protein B5M09_004988 [Aphanomyces astaci]